MTREEAILHMTLRRAELEHSVGDLDEDIRAFDMAIDALEQEPKILDTLDFAVDASNGETNYFVGFRNGLRYSKSLIDGKEPQFENCTEQEPCEDAISRAEAIRIASGYCHWTNIPDELEKLPSVTPKQKMGHWVPTDKTWAGINECSICGYRKDVHHKMDFCPSCGADMRGE